MIRFRSTVKSQCDKCTVNPNHMNADGTTPKRRLLLRVTLWTVASVALAVVFLGYQQVDLAIAWITAKLC